jgi:hypothetical protein
MRRGSEEADLPGSAAAGLVSIVVKEPLQIARSMIDVQDFNSLGNRAVEYQIVFEARHGEEANIA